MNRALLLLLLSLNASAVLAQEPSASQFLPPDVPPRPPLPTGFNSASGSTNALALNAPAPAKESLAWRVKAHKLRTATNAKQRSLSTNYDAAIMALISALSTSGLRVQTLNSKAGELLAAPADAFAKQRFVFVIAEMPPGTVTIKAQPFQNNKEANALIDSVFAALSSATSPDTPRGAE